MKKENVYPILAHKLTDVLRVSKIVSMHYFEFDKNYVFPGESHDFWEMVYVDSGSVHITAAKTMHTLRQGEIIFHKPNEFHTISSDKKNPANVFVISFVATSKNMAWFRNRKTILSDNLRQYITILLSEGKKTFDTPFNIPNAFVPKVSENSPFGSQQIIRNTLEQLLIMLIRGEEENPENSYIFFDKESMDNHLINSVIEILKENIYGRVTVDEICRKVNYSKTYISRIFNKSCGYTIIEYYTRLKIKEAKKLIREDMYSFAEISNRLCFNNPHYFTRVFKRTANMTPREYKNSVVK